MVKLIDQVQQFYALAAGKSSIELSYDDFVNNAKHLRLSFMDMLRKMDKFKQYPFFKLENFLPALYTELKHVKLDSYEVDTLHTVYKDFYNPVMKYCLTELMKEDKDFLLKWFTLKTYLYYEKIPDLPPDVLRKAQSIIVMSILDAYNYAINDTVETEEDANSVDKVKRLIARDLAQLMDSSTKFSQEFKMRLAKHFGPEMFADIIGQTRGLEGHRISNKLKYNKFDIAYLFDHRIRSTDKDTFQEIIDQSDSGAKEYLRGYLYEDVSLMGSKEALFMLSEDMTPMNIDYQPHMLPGSVRILRLSEIRDKNYQNKWLEVFHSFHIIPH